MDWLGSGRRRALDLESVQAGTTVNPREVKKVVAVGREVVGRLR